MKGYGGSSIYARGYISKTQKAASRYTAVLTGSGRLIVPQVWDAKGRAISKCDGTGPASGWGFCPIAKA
jgi:hypothetical protein